MEQREQLAIRSVFMRTSLADIVSKPVALDSHNIDKTECTLEARTLMHFLIPNAR